ncbi:MAG TPA: lysylphosphatidylglycerol synthase transmembrane domain-containing protein [Gemmatimonadaceae bacterium]|nr:lysylphosphatidylglycerol synthase transmembrane domain-containing protein [Gemmatimonadaceae bacterium]
MVRYSIAASLPFRASVLVSWRRWLLTIISFAASIGVSAFIVVQTWPEGRLGVSLPVLAHVLALCAALLEIAGRVLKLNTSAIALGIPLTIGTSARTCLAGDFGASITPARSGGEPARFLVLSEARVPVSSSVLLLYAELFLEMISLAVVALALWLIFPVSRIATAGMVTVVGGYAGTVLGLAVVGMILARRRAAGPAPRWARAVGLGAGRWRAIQRALRRMRSGFSAVRRLKLRWAAISLLLSVIHLLARFAVLPALVLTYDPTVPIAPLVIWPMVLFYGGVAVPAPAGGGVIEVGFAAALGDVIPAPIFAASLIWWRFYTFYLLLLLGAIATGRTVLHALRGQGRKRAVAPAFDDPDPDDDLDAPLPSPGADERIERTR